MKKLACFSIILFMGLSCLAQEVEFCSSMNTSSEQRFQSAYGMGLQYQHEIGAKYKAGLGVHYNLNSVEFTEQPYIDAIPFPPSIEKINSNSKRFSIRLNIQRLIKNNENVSISIGPEVSYNYLWGVDDIKLFLGGGTGWSSFSRNNSVTKEIGLGLISKIEVKGFIHPKLALCITIRPELIANGVSEKGGDSPFTPGMGFIEFQLGLKYRFKE